MNLKKDLGTNLSMLFLLGLTAIVATIFHFAEGATLIFSENQANIQAEFESELEY